MVDARDFVRLVLDPTRLAVLGRSAEGSVHAEAVATALGVPVRRVHTAIAKLRTAGLLTDELLLDRAALGRRRAPARRPT